ncbi:MAG: hypothetical protein MUF64_08055 [Polyangiaceae bacterium]|jgi:hypothetical protein|nr:hypothetical protein [Polyangiaceae bacterium]
MQETPARKSLPTDEDGGFLPFRAAVQATFAAITATERPLFLTRQEGLFELFLEHLPPELRQHYTCSCCRRFIRAYGGLIAVREDGSAEPALWPDPEQVPVTFRRSVEALRARVEAAPIDRVFYTSSEIIGTPKTGEWDHLAVPIPAARRHQSLVQTAGQRAAEKTQDRAILERGLAEFSSATLMKALEHLTSGQLYRSEKAEAMVHWLLGLHEQRSVRRDERRQENLLWVAVALAPAGFCHVRTNMISTLLEDILTGMPFEHLRRRWAEKMDPSRYMRAQAAPAAGNIAQAEKIIDKLKATGSLERRYARLEDMKQFLWRAVAASEPRQEAAGVFQHLNPREPAAPSTPVGQRITWEEFQHTVLPEATHIEARIPGSQDRFMALVTAAQAEAPPILQWDQEGDRNPVSWYYAAGIDAEIRRRVLEAGGTHEGCDIRVSLLWNNRNDLDLHMTTPAGEHIYFGSKKAACGGWLDVDMNVRGETTKPVENIRWLKGASRPGLHQVTVQNYRFHDPSAPTPFRIELEVEGQVFHHDGVISPGGETGVASDILVTEFEHTPGKKLAAPPRNMRPAEHGNTWNVRPGQWVPVTCIVPSPNLWGDRPTLHHGRHLFFLLQGCRDTDGRAARGFFSEALKSEFHPIRSTMEAYTASAALTGADEATACGLGMSDQSPWDLELRVTSSRGRHSYLVERWG